MSPTWLRFPRYESSGHPVAMFEPELLMQDVSSWLSEPAQARPALTP